MRFRLPDGAYIDSEMLGLAMEDADLCTTFFLISKLARWHAVPIMMMRESNDWRRSTAMRTGFLLSASLPMKPISGWQIFLPMLSLRMIACLLKNCPLR